MKASLTRVFTLAFALLLALPAPAEPLRVVYPATENPGDTRFDDLKELLRAALDHTLDSHGPYTLSTSRSYMTEARYLAELQRGGEVNVVWSSTSAGKERDLLPLRIPLRKGLLGFRIALIDGRRQAAFDRVGDIAALRRLTIGQGIGWGDVKLYEAAGVPVITAPYENLFRMVASGRFDLFPRGIGEVFHEYAERRADIPNLAIEQHLMLYYPWPYYFFFNRRDTALAHRVELGLQRMRADGSFDALFWKYNRIAIEQANLAGRRLIRLPNPLLPKDTPLADPTLWFDPMRDKPPANTTP